MSNSFRETDKDGNPINVPIGTAHIDSQGKQGGTAWVQRSIPAPGTEMRCSICSSLKPWAMFDRRTGRGMCDACRAAGNRFGEKEG